jgi:hypothetical protein
MPDTLEALAGTVDSALGEVYIRGAFIARGGLRRFLRD